RHPLAHLRHHRPDCPRLEYLPPAHPSPARRHGLHHLGSRHRRRLCRRREVDRHPCHLFHPPVAHHPSHRPVVRHPCRRLVVLRLCLHLAVRRLVARHPCHRRRGHHPCRHLVVLRLCLHLRLRPPSLRLLRLLRCPRRLGRHPA